MDPDKIGEGADMLHISAEYDVCGSGGWKVRSHDMVRLESIL